MPCNIYFRPVSYLQSLDLWRDLYAGRDLFWHCFTHIWSPAMWSCTDPLMSGAAFALFSTFAIFAVQEYNGNYSQVDRLWPFFPAFYVLHDAAFAYNHGLLTTRVLNVTILVQIWAWRLFYNYYRKGGYARGSEDYRWEIVRAKAPQWALKLFSFSFIALWQNYLLLSITAPVYAMIMYEYNTKLFSAPLSRMEIIVEFAMLVTVLTEYLADEQQWQFHQAKHGKKNTGFSKTEIKRGFNTKGLWAFSRHPNFACEQLFWVLLYVHGAVTTSLSFNWTIVGAVAYLALFQGSTWLTEKLSAGKYKEYKEYQKRVPMFFPLFLNRWVDKVKM